MKHWLIGCIGIGLAGCTYDGGEAEFKNPGMYECRARVVGYEDLPVYIINSETADGEVRAGIGALSSITMTTTDGERVTFTGASPPGYFCVQIESW